MGAENSVAKNKRAVLARLEKGLVRTSDVLLLAGSVVLFIFMLYVVSDVAGRFLFKKPIPATIEVSGLVLAFAVGMSFAAALAQGRHIRVTALVERFAPPGLRDWLEILALFLGFVVTFLVCWESLFMAIDSVLIREISYTWRVSLYPGKIAFFVGFVFFCIFFFVQFLSHLGAKMRGKIPAEMKKS